MKHLATYKKKLNIHVFRDILTLKGICEKKKTDSIGKLYVSSRNGDIYIKGEGGQTESSLPSLSTRDPIKRLTKQTKGRLSWLAPGLRCLSPRVTAPEESHGSPATTERIPATRSSSRFAGNKKKRKPSFFAPSPPDYDYPCTKEYRISRSQVKSKHGFYP